jgi:NADH-quinone oxidoreductase subunit G
MTIIEINGKKVEAETGSMIIEVADHIGIQIPRFCYHKKLSIAANCRMCLVEVEKAPKPLPACATPVTEGMKVWTRSPKALMAQKSVMEFLLINHPLDCPICDQGGECELQDLAMGYGEDVSRFTEGKRVVQDKNIGPLIATDMTRCIHCTRCVRFGTEVAGVRELGATGRGEHMEIGTYIEKNVDSEVSGNVIDLCPVGALTSKPYRFTARGWELSQKPSIAPHDGVGSNIFLHIRRNEIMRVVPRENESINEVWLSDRDRFSYEGLNSPERLQQPKIKRNGRWYTVSWQDALEETSQTLMDLTKTHGGNALGTVVSPNATVEECYLLQKLIRGLGCHNIDHRLRQTDFRNQEGTPLFPNLGIAINMIEQQSAVLLVGSDIRKEQPILGLKLRKMTLAGGKALVINPADFAFNFEVTEKIIVEGGELVLGLAKVAKAVLEQLNPLEPSEKDSQKSTSIPAISATTNTSVGTNLLAGAAAWLKEVVTDEVAVEMANQLIQGEKKLILLGALALSHPAFSHLIALANTITKLTGAQLGILNEGANSAGAWLTACVPHRLPGGISAEKEQGLNTQEMWAHNLKGYLLFNVEPELDCLEGMKALQALQKAKRVIAITSFESKSLLEYADILLPLTPFTETSGTWINMEGQWQSFQAVVTPKGESRPGWKICRVLGNLCGLSEFDYNSSEEVRAAFSEAILASADPLKDWDWECPQTLELLKAQDHNPIIRIAPVPLYAVDGLVRRAESLQKTKDAGNASIRLNKHLMSRLGLTENRARVNHAGMSLTLPFVLDDSIPDHCVFIDGGIAETIVLGGSYTSVEIQAIKEQNA